MRPEGPASSEIDSETWVPDCGLTSPADRHRRGRRKDELGGGVLAEGVRCGICTTQMEDQDGKDRDDNDDAGREQDDEKEAGPIGRLLFDLTELFLQELGGLLLDASGKVFGMVRLLFHVVLDASWRGQGSWNRSGFHA